VFEEVSILKFAQAF